MSRRHPNGLHPFGLQGFVITAVLALSGVVQLLPASSLALVRQESLQVGPMQGIAAGRSDPPLNDSALQAEQQAGALYSVGRYEEALRLQQHSVQLHRQLAAQDPSQRLNLAASLHNLGVVLIRLGRKSEAIQPTQESLAIYREESAGGRADSAALERPLRNLVLLYFEANRPQEALPLADELVRLHQSKTAEAPTLEAEGMDVLNLRASLLVALNRPQEAFRDLEVAVSLGRRLLQRSPKDPGLQYGLAGSLVNLSQVADLLGKFSLALRPAQEAEELLRQVARAQPQLIGDWAKSLSRLGQAYAQVGEADTARAPLQESIALLRLLSRSGPAETLVVEPGGYRDDLAHALETLAIVQHQLMQPQEARSTGEEALAIYRGLAEVEPRYGKDVSRTRSWLTDLIQSPPLRR